MKVRRFIYIIFIFVHSANILKAQSVEYAIKASFIEKFARFTDWQTISRGEYFTIDILGKSPFKGELEKIAQKVKIKNKPIKLNYISNYSQAANCQVLFICSSEKNNLNEILNFTSSLDILTISDTPGYCKKGVHINFYIDESGTVKYEINLAALKKNKLMVDMQLLSFGKIIK
jgi:hypothetical protein